MSRTAVHAVACLFAAAGAAAQETGTDADPAVDFILRPTSAAGEDAFDDDFWTDQLESELQDAVIGPPLAGPSPNAPVGPLLAGPLPAPRPAPTRSPSPEEQPDPFAATGLGLGSFVIRPAIEIGVSATDNAADDQDKQAAIGIVIAPELVVRSEDDRHEIEADVRGEAILYGEKEFDEREAEARIRGRYDLTRTTSLRAEAGYRYTLDRFTDPDTPAAATQRPAVHDFDAALGLTQRFGRVSLGVAGTVERGVHEDVPLASGGIASRDELDNTSYGLRVRATYEASPALQPFVETGVGRRAFDQEIDDSGFERSATWGELRGGVLFDLGEKFNGEAALGYRRENLDDERLGDLDAIIASASVFWSPRRLTEIRATLTTEARPTSIPDSSGSVLYAGTLSVARKLTRKLAVEAGLDLDHERFDGIDRRDWTFTGFTETNYAFNRTASLVARYEYERTDSTDSGADADAHVVSVRLRLQR